jgi:hypothetical protein
VHGLDIGEDGRDVEDGVFRVVLEHEVKIAAVPAVELLAELIHEFRGKDLGDVPSLTDASNQA